MKRLFIALLAAGVVTTAVIASAASLTVTTNTLGAGNAAVSSCNSTAVDTIWTSAYESAIGEYEVDDITIDGITGNTCNGALLRVQLTTAGDATTGPEYTYTIQSSDTDHTFDASGDNTPADTVTGVAVVIVGP